MSNVNFNQDVLFNSTELSNQNPEGFREANSNGRQNNGCNKKFRGGCKDNQENTEYGVVECLTHIIIMGKFIK